MCYVMFEQPDGTEGGAGAPEGDADDDDDGETETTTAAAASNGDEAAAGVSTNGQQQEQEQEPQQQQQHTDGDAAAVAGAEPLQGNGAQPGTIKPSNKKNRRKRQRSPSKSAAAAAATASSSSRRKVSRVRIDEFPVASQLICSLMPLLRVEVMGSDVLRHKLFQVNFHTTLSNQAMITMTYHKQVGV